MKPLFRPLCYSPHLQTILPTCLPAKGAPITTSQHIALADGDFLSCEISRPLDWTKERPTLVLVHGLGGSAHSKYMQRLANKGYSHALQVVCVNLRGCGSGHGLSKKPYSAAASDDILAVLQWLKQESPSSKITLAGFSLGANIVLKLAGEQGSQMQDLVQCSIAISPPLDLFESVQLIQKRCHLLYHVYYLRKICAQAKPWQKEKVSSLYAFDDTITAPFWGYKSAFEYYKSASSINFLPKIRSRCHVLLAEDDPFVNSKILKNVVLPESLQLTLTPHGGHMGFLQKRGDGQDIFWLEEMIFYWMEDANRGYF